MSDNLHSFDDIDDWDDEDEDLEPVEGYCMTCRDTIEMEDPQAVWTSQGRPGTRGICPYCGGSVYRLGHTEAHDAMKRPDAIQVVDQSGVKRTSKAARIKIEAATYIVGAAEDHHLILQLADDLRKVGVSTWTDDGDGVQEVNWAGGVHPALTQCKKMVVVLSEAALKSEAVEEAWRYFRTERKPIVVALAEAVEPPDDLRTRPRFTLYGDYKGGFRQIWQTLSR